MALVQGAWHDLLSPGLAIELKNCYFENGNSIGFKIYGSINIDEGPPVRELHVVDIGDGMLVPVQLLEDLFGR